MYGQHKIANLCHEVSSVPKGGKQNDKQNLRPSKIQQSEKL